MASLAVMEAFETRLQQWDSIDNCPMINPNEVAQEPVKPPFVEVEYPLASERKMTLGSPAIFREQGGARIVITIAAFQPGWRPEVFGWIEQLRDLFRDRKLGLVQTEDASPAVLDDRNAAGSRYRVAFVVTYTYDAVR